MHETQWPLRAEGGGLRELAGEEEGRRRGGRGGGGGGGGGKEDGGVDTFPDDVSDKELRGEACFGARARPPVG